MVKNLPAMQESPPPILNYFFKIEFSEPEFRNNVNV